MPRIKGRHNSTFEDTPPVRTGGRVKKARIVFDPSVNNMPKRRGRAISLGGSVSMQISDKSSDSPPKLKKMKSSLATEQIYMDNHKSFDAANKNRKQPAVLEAQISDSCMICERAENKKERKLIPCKDCNYKVHASCLKINFQNQNLLEEHWRCNNCTTCVVCYETSEAGTLITCCICVDSYHLACHIPKLHKTLNKLKWECSKCQNINKNVAFEKIPMNVSSDEGDKKNAELKTSRQGAIEIEIYPSNNNDNARKRNSLTEETNDKDTKQTKPKDAGGLASFLEEKECDDEIPDISDWSCEKVYKYVERYFPQEAIVLRDHDIDGASLLLMKRSDVIRGLPLKLGPAIRLYSFIVRLQSKSNDPRLTWM